MAVRARHEKGSVGMWHHRSESSTSRSRPDGRTTEQAQRSISSAALAPGRAELTPTVHWVPDGAVAREPRTAWSRRTSCRVRALRAKGQPARSSLRRPACATARADRCCGSGNDRVHPWLLAISSMSSATQRRSDQALHPDHDFPRRPCVGRESTSFEVSADHRRHRAATHAESDADVRAGLLALLNDELAAVRSLRECGGPRVRLTQRVPSRAAAQIASCRESCRHLRRGCRPGRSCGVRRRRAALPHAYNDGAFLSARNHPSDGYGGSRENRVRLTIEVFAAVRAAVPARFRRRLPLSQSTIASRRAAAWTMRRISGGSVARAGMDFMSLSRGGKFEDAKQRRWILGISYTGPSGWECMPTVLADEAGSLRRNVERRHGSGRGAAWVSRLRLLSRRVHNFAAAERILSSGAADVIGAARQSLAIQTGS